MNTPSPSNTPTRSNPAMIWLAISAVVVATIAGGVYLRYTDSVRSDMSIQDAMSSKVYDLEQAIEDGDIGTFNDLVRDLQASRVDLSDIDIMANYAGKGSVVKPLSSWIETIVSDSKNRDNAVDKKSNQKSQSVRKWSKRRDNALDEAQRETAKKVAELETTSKTNGADIASLKSAVDSLKDALTTNGNDIATLESQIDSLQGVQDDLVINAGGRKGASSKEIRKAAETRIRDRAKMLQQKFQALKKQLEEK